MTDHLTTNCDGPGVPIIQLSLPKLFLLYEELMGKGCPFAHASETKNPGLCSFDALETRLHDRFRKEIG